MKRSHFRLSGVILLLALLTVSCQKSNKNDPLVVYSGFAIGTTYLIKIANPKSSVSEANLKGEIEALLHEVDIDMSTFNPESEIYQFNHYFQTDDFQVSPETLRVLIEAKRIAEMTDGAFDPTVGILVDLWGFGPTARDKRVPPADQIESSKRHVNFRDLILNQDKKTVRKTDPIIMVDLAAIAKGRSVDMVAERLEEKGYKNYLVEIGGEIRTNGVKPDGSAWLVAIERPEASQRSIQKIVKLSQLSMATSGDYRNFFEIDGKRYSHALNPFTGYPVENNVASVSIVHKSCMTADALATGLMVLGPEKGIQVANAHNIAALFITRQDDKLIEKSSIEFERFLTQNEVKRE